MFSIFIASIAASFSPARTVLAWLHRDVDQQARHRRQQHLGQIRRRFERHQRLELCRAGDSTRAAAAVVGDPVVEADALELQAEGPGVVAAAHRRCRAAPVERHHVRLVAERHVQAVAWRFTVTGVCCFLPSASVSTTTKSSRTLSSWPWRWPVIEVARSR